MIARRAVPGRYVDTAYRLTTATIAAVKAAGYLGVFRYVRLPDNGIGSDITAEELDAICQSGLTCGLVQHVRGPASGLQGWQPSKHSGVEDALTAMAAAQAVGYPEDAHVFVDLEDISDTSEAAEKFAADWHDTVKIYKPATYVGFAVPLSPSQLYALLGDCYWTDPGNRLVAVRGCAIHQGKTVTIAGAAFDEDVVAPDSLGGVPWMAAHDDAIT